MCSNSFSMSWFWHQLWAKTIPKRKRFGDVFSRNTNGNLEENHGKNGEGGGVTVWSCDKSVSVCTHRSSGEGFQKHLHKHKVVSEKSRKYTLCNMYNSTKSSNINLHYLVQYEKKTILVGRMNIQWLDSLVCSVYSKVCSLFEQGGHESITQVHITKAASTPNRWVSFCPGLSKLTVSLCSKWWRTWR